MKSKPQPELEYKDSQPIISRLSSSCVYLNINLSSVYWTLTYSCSQKIYGIWPVCEDRMIKRGEKGLKWIINNKNTAFVLVWFAFQIFFWYFKHYNLYCHDGKQRQKKEDGRIKDEVWVIQPRNNSLDEWVPYIIAKCCPKNTEKWHYNW